MFKYVTFVKMCFILYNKKKDALLRKIKAIVLPDSCHAINLIVVGRKGSGKSSFVNTLLTVFRDNGQISTIAASYGVNVSCTTNKVSYYILACKTYYIGKNTCI